MSATKAAAALLTVHLLWCLVVGLLLRLRILRWEYGLFPLVLFVPCWGTLGALLVHRKTSPYRRWSAADSLYDTAEIAPTLPTEFPCHAAELVPLEEALLLDTAAQRRRLMLLLLADDPVRHYALLELARYDKDSEVAHYAATAMALAGKRADQALDALQQQYAAAPQDPERRAACQQQLQQMLEEGLVQGHAATLLRRQREELLQVSMRQAPDCATGCQLAETQLALQEYAAARRTIGLLLRFWPRQEEPWLLRLRCAAACRDGAALQAAMREIQTQQIWFSAAGRETLRFWQGKAQEEDRYETVC